MRVKITGPITVDRLTEAVMTAAEKFEAALGKEFAGFFGANLYLSAYTLAGEPVDLLDEFGKPVMITLPVSVSQIASEDSSESAELKLEHGEEAEQLKREAIEQENQRLALEIEERYSLMFAARQPLVEEQERRDRQFMALVAAYGMEFIDACNAAIAQTWEHLQPTWPHGARKGQLRARPILKTVGLDVQLGTLGGKSFRKIRSPLSHVSSSLWSGSQLKTYWQHDGWVTGAIPALSDVIEHFQRRNLDDVK